MPVIIDEGDPDEADVIAKWADGHTWTVDGLQAGQIRAGLPKPKNKHVCEMVHDVTGNKIVVKRKIDRPSENSTSKVLMSIFEQERNIVNIKLGKFKIF